MQFLVSSLRDYPEIALFLTLAVGFWFGNVKIGTFSLGAVTSTLVAGLLIGQFGIHIPPIVADTFFTMFLFAVGYSAGPQFFPALKKDGVPQVIFALVVCGSGLLSAYVAAKLLGYGPGLAAGLLAGGYTNSGTLGVAAANMKELGLDPAQTASQSGLAAIAYAVSYPFGAAASAWFLSSLAPKLLGIDLPGACKTFAATQGGRKPEPGVGSAYRPVLTRAFRVESAELVGRTPRELNATLEGAFITRYRDNDRLLEPDCDVAIRRGVALAIAGSPQALQLMEQKVGPEVDDAELLAYATEETDLVVTSKKAANRTVGELERDGLAQFGRPLFLLRVSRGGQDLTPTPDLVLQRWDVLTVRGPRKQVEQLGKDLGYVDRATSQSDIAFMAAGVVIGSLVGAITVHVGGIPLSLSPSVGTLVAGLVFGYLRSVYRTFGRIPEPAVWVFNNVGLNGFIAVVGLNAGPGLVSGLESNGISLFLAGVAVTLVPLIVAVLLGRYVFKFHPAVLFGACAGARSSSAALGAVQEAAKSAVPVIGYTVPYAVSRLVLAVFGVLVLLILK
ncbi:MAG TPA: aspartate-alanine antiporter [Aliidongia sp.]|nr:aspartate-alanine antiporter [Aliidongia sp.]